MAKRHDENKDLRAFARIGKVQVYDRTLRASKSATIGIHMWGRIDFLTHYCGWMFFWDNSAGVGFRDTPNEKPNFRTAKKERKAPKLTDKTKKTHKK